MNDTKQNIPAGIIRNIRGQIVSYSDPDDDYWYKRTFDSHGRELTFQSSLGFWRVKTLDIHGRDLTYVNSDGLWREFYHDLGVFVENMRVHKI